jgi:hypothetical protein
MENKIDYSTLHQGIRDLIKLVESDKVITKSTLIGRANPLSKQHKMIVLPIINRIGEGEIEMGTREQLRQSLMEIAVKVQSTDASKPETDANPVSKKTYGDPAPKEYLPYNNKKNPTRNKVGDVIMHPVFKHPYVLLEKKEGYWVAALFTSEKKCKEILEKCDSRLFDDNYITRTLITIEKPFGSFIYPYDNLEQLKRVHKKLTESMAPSKKGIFAKIINLIKK